MAESRRDAAYEAKRRVTLVTAVVNLLLAVGKIAGGLIGNSQALVVDGVHSLSDLAGDALVLWAAWIGTVGADRNHPYGHKRFETAAALGIGALLLLIAGGFAFDALGRLARADSLAVPSVLALSVAVISVLANEALYHYSQRVGERYHSDLIIANAWHHRSDALSSVVVIVAVLGAIAGAPWLDALAALIVALMVGAVGCQLGWRAVRELVDTGLDEAELAELGALIRGVDGVRDFDDLRTRRMGGATLVDVRIRVDGELSVRQAHGVAEAVRATLRRRAPHTAEILVRIAPD